MCAGVAAGLLVCRLSPPSGRAGKPALAPDFRLDTLDGARFYLNAQRARATVLVFWDTSCTVCKQEMVDLQRMSGPPDVLAAGVAAICTDPENLDTARDIVRQLDIRYPVLLDHGARVRDLYRVSALPTTVVVGPDRRERLRRVGYDANVQRQIRETIRSLTRAAD